MQNGESHYLSLMGIDIWVPRETKTASEVFDIPFFRFEAQTITGILLFKMEALEKPFEHKIYRFIEGFLFAFSFQYNRPNHPRLTIEELEKADLIIQFGTLPTKFIEQYNKSSKLIMNKSCLHYIQNPLEKALLWKNCRHLLLFAN